MPSTRMPNGVSTAAKFSTLYDMGQPDPPLSPIFLTMKNSPFPLALKMVKLSQKL